MKLILATALAAAGLAMTVGASSAMTMAPNVASGNALVQDVAGGCGPGWHPNPWGRCVPNRGVYRPAPRYAPAPYYRPEPGYVPRRGCPRGMHPGNSGRCVPNY
ncbi:GCG_CRPN prefix-to-repeats domain-containing protein [Labrys monachus]|uniref:GCG_CRPN prefix-to-repeats domain-containing protein n=1 Tax=Labrys monachus TaxID=217067 RepID=UPI0035217F04